MENFLYPFKGLKGSASFLGEIFTTNSHGFQEVQTKTVWKAQVEVHSIAQHRSSILSGQEWPNKA
jgi:hypothetical protein